jgi:hypothetical protein
VPSIEVQFTEVGDVFADVPNVTTDASLEVAPGIAARQPLLLSDTGPIAVVFEIAAGLPASIVASLIAAFIWERIKPRKVETIRLSRKIHRFDSEGQLREIIEEELESNTRG